MAVKQLLLLWLYHLLMKTEKHHVTQTTLHGGIQQAQAGTLQNKFVHEIRKLTESKDRNRKTNPQFTKLVYS